jgi:hypothetical protein
MWKLGAGAALAMSTMLGGAASAQNLLVNGDFEISEDRFEGGLLNGSTFPGWDCTGFCFSIEDDNGNSFAAIRPPSSAVSFGELIQSVETVIGATYRFSFAHAIGQEIEDPSTSSGFSLGSGPRVAVPPTDDFTEFTQVFIATETTTDVRLFLEADSFNQVTAIFENVSFVLIALPVTTTEEELSALLAAAGGAARLVVLDAQGIARDLGQASIVARGQQLSLELAQVTEGSVVASSKSATPGLVGNLYTWAQITGFDSEDDDGPGSIRGTGFQIGADVALGADMVAGLSLGRSELNASEAGFSQDGTLTYLQPYLAYRAGAWHGNASLIFGQGDYDQTSDGGTGTGETKLFAVTFEAGYDMALREGLTLTPTIGLIAGNEKATGTSGTLAGAGTQTYDFAQASLGARLTSRTATGQLFAGLHADYLDQDAGAVLTSEFLSENGWSGRVEFGASREMQGGFGLATSFDISGIGGSAQTLSGGLRVALQF